MVTVNSDAVKSQNISTLSSSALEFTTGYVAPQRPHLTLSMRSWLFWLEKLNYRSHSAQSRAEYQLSNMKSVLCYISYINLWKLHFTAMCNTGMFIQNNKHKIIEFNGFYSILCRQYDIAIATHGHAWFPVSSRRCHLAVRRLPPAKFHVKAAYLIEDHWRPWLL